MDAWWLPSRWWWHVMNLSNLLSVVSRVAVYFMPQFIWDPKSGEILKRSHNNRKWMQNNDFTAHMKPWITSRCFCYTSVRPSGRNVPTMSIRTNDINTDRQRLSTFFPCTKVKPKKKSRISHLLESVCAADWGTLMSSIFIYCPYWWKASYMDVAAKKLQILNVWNHAEVLYNLISPSVPQLWGPFHKRKLI